MTQRWSLGDRVVLRYVGLDNGWVVGWPQIVVEDAPERVVLYQPAGTNAENVRGVSEDRRSGLMPAWNRADWPRFYELPLGLLRIMPTHASHAVEVYFGAEAATPPHYSWLDASGHHRGFKVNLQSRFARTPIGFDTTDNTLDLVMGTDLVWRSKDEDELAMRVDVGLTLPNEAAGFREEARRVIADIERRAEPFNQPWHEWRPDPAWTTPRLPEGWADVAGAGIDLNRRRPGDEDP